MTDDPRLETLGSFTREGKLTPGYGDHYLFFVGRDDCHGVLEYLIPLEKRCFKLNMFGYDDDELNELIFSLFNDKSLRVQASLDRSQAGGVHEKKIIALDEQQDPIDFNNSFVILESSSHQISHTKGGLFVSQGIGFEGSMNWSNSGEGTGINLSGDNPTGYKAQNNTLLVSTNPVFLSRFGDQLDAEHLVGIQQLNKRRTK